MLTDLCNPKWKTAYTKSGVNWNKLAVYVLYTKEGTLVYIGVSTKLLKRLSSHTIKWYKVKYKQFDYSQALAAASLESRLMQRLKPKRNTHIQLIPDVLILNKSKELML